LKKFSVAEGNTIERSKLICVIPARETENASKGVSFRKLRTILTKANLLLYLKTVEHETNFVS